VHPLRREGGHRRRGAADGVRAVRGRAGARHAAPVREHLQQPRVLRAGILRGQAPRPQGRPGLDARVRDRVQGMQQRVARAPGRRARRRQPLERLRPPLPDAAATAVQDSQTGAAVAGPRHQCALRVLDAVGRASAGV
jgi:hypothetical protein